MNQCARFTLVTALVFTFGCSASTSTGSSVRDTAGTGNSGGGAPASSGGSGNSTSFGGLNIEVGGVVESGGGAAGTDGKSCDGKLTGYVRDFLAAQSPDFEPFVKNGFPNRMPGKMDNNVIEAGIVGMTLGDDKKPIYMLNDGSTSLTTTGKTNFDTWFHDTPNINMGKELSLQFTLDPADPTMKTYKFDSAPNGFFPIDNQLLSPTLPAEGQAHNFSFTFELHTLFTYAQGQKFNFRGDDDVWAFIDKKLVVDLGGIHDAFTKNVDLDTLGLVVGQTYPLDFFFAERHIGASDFLVRDLDRIHAVRYRREVTVDFRRG
jgi:fibro-slime domain-containing protein